MGDGSLDRAVFQRSPGEVFRGSCGARKRSARRASRSPVFRLASAFRVLSYTYPISVSLLSCLCNLSFSLYFRLPARFVATRHMDAYEERPLRCVAREKGLGNHLRDSLPSLNEREILHTAHRAGSFSLSLPLLSSFSLSFDLVPSSFASAIRVIPFVCFYLSERHISFVHGS